MTDKKLPEAARLVSEGSASEKARLVPESVLDELMDRVDREGAELLGPDGLLSQVTKAVLTDIGSVDLEVARDRNGTFEPRIVPKGARRLKGFNERIVALYARGMTVRDIRSHLAEIYDVDVSPDLISKVTDAVWGELEEWRNRPLDSVYPIEWKWKECLAPSHRFLLRSRLWS